MFCQECGQKLPEGAKHCPYCGAMVEAAPPPEPEEAGRGRCAGGSVLSGTE